MYLDKLEDFKIQKIKFLTINELLQISNLDDKNIIGDIFLREDLNEYTGFYADSNNNLLIYNHSNKELFKITNTEIIKYELDIPLLQYIPEYMILYEKRTKSGLSTNFENMNEDEVIKYVAFIKNKVNLCLYCLNGSSNTFSLVYEKLIIDPNNTNIRIFGLLWWDTPNNTNILLMVITSIGLYLYEYNDDNLIIKWQEEFLCHNAWYELDSKTIVLQVGPNTLTPLLYLRTESNNIGIQKSQNLDLLLNREIESDEVIILNLYGDIFCTHLDYFNGRVSLRDLYNQDNIDLVLDIDNKFKKFSLFLLDNILVIISLEGNKNDSIKSNNDNLFNIIGFYDIKLLPNIKNNKYKSLESDSNIDNLEQYYYIIPCLYEDNCSDNIFINIKNKSDLMNLDSFIDKDECDDTKSIRYLNKYSELPDVNNIYLILRNGCNLLIFISKKDFNSSNNKYDISFNKIHLSNRKIMEKIILPLNNIDNKEINLKVLPLIFNRKNWNNDFYNYIQEFVEFEKSNNKVLNNNLCNSYPRSINILLEILQVMYEVNITPEFQFYKLIIELILFYKIPLLLRQLLQYHIIEDSNQLLLLLLNFYTEYNKIKKTNLIRYHLDDNLNNINKLSKSDPINEIKDNNQFNINEEKYLDEINLNSQISSTKSLNYLNLEWLGQICLDMANRLQNIYIIIEILIINKQYRRIIPILKDKSKKSLYGYKQVSSYPLHKILKIVGMDIIQQQKDPLLLKTIITQIKEWFDEYNINNQTVCKPNIKKCQRWLPLLYEDEVGIEADYEDNNVVSELEPDQILSNKDMINKNESNCTVLNNLSNNNGILKITPFIKLPFVPLNNQDLRLYSDNSLSVTSSSFDSNDNL
ncbi:uncharacterized protein CMU_027600 [Cryptosporidium muris RN66]|uniref:Mic1 domain-containing protein n=1 Tax=Cryptosporidium muris (strain RN66) TaxID=441375 RepID=B6ABJ8_CRYMR|nr:uncharacterized protein CMU_027600 [Cryptosporidium muris RN66]EEA05750.1 hypothetical protein, conserved [Cryptosporidium muris RN66]|eukprot:XP_002140099.1 hypothetical protein [Cryptosporidium muris RN66]